MEILFELFLTALLSLVVAFFLAKLLAVASASGGGSEGDLGGNRGADVAEEEEVGGGSDGGLEGRRVVEDREIRAVVPSVVEVREVGEVGRVELVERDLDDDEDGDEERLGTESVAAEGGGVISGRELGSEMEKGLIVDVSAARSEGNLDEQVEKVGISGNEGGEAIESERAEKCFVGQKEKLFNDEDDWEGIEKSDLERRFAVVSGMVASDEGGVLEKVGSDVHMQLYALHKIATEGPCYEPQPSMLKSSARAKWNAWQQLGNMNPDLAMEQYISLVSESIPDWKDSISTKQEEQIVSPVKVCGTDDPDMSSPQGQHLDSAIERNPDIIQEAETIAAGPSDGAKLSEQGHAS